MIAMADEPRRLAFGQQGLQTAALMPSQLWERLRAARRYADLTQREVAIAVGLTRSAVAQWEAAEAEQRTRPSAEHLIVFSKLTKAPLEWLMNDASRLDDLYKLASENDGMPSPSAQAPPKVPEVLPDVRQGDQLFCFASSPEQVAAKLAQLATEDPRLERHLILVGVKADLKQVSSLSEALAYVASQLDDRR